MNRAQTRHPDAWPVLDHRHTYGVGRMLNVHDCTCPDDDCEGGGPGSDSYEDGIDLAACLYCQFLPQELDCPCTPGADDPNPGSAHTRAELLETEQAALVAGLARGLPPTPGPPVDLYAPPNANNEPEGLMGDPPTPGGE